MSLVKEPISPNVTKIIPIHFDRMNTIRSDDFDVTIHNGNIFEFTCNRPIMTGSVDGIRNMFTKYEEAGHLYPVTVTGLKTGGKEQSEVGSTRFCTMDPSFATILTDVISNTGIFGAREFAKDWYTFANVSQYFRFMKYEKGGEHFPHYDSDFDFGYSLRSGCMSSDHTVSTKMSMVVYFTNNNSGEIAFVHDPRKEHNNTDWNRQATEEETYLKILPRALKIVIFDHDVCHTVLPFKDDDGDRIICRGDLIFEKM